MTQERRDAEEIASEARFSSPPAPAAPVVTDEGVYGTLPRMRSYAEYEDAPDARRHPLLALATAVLVLSAGLWLVVVSASQATSETVAIPTIGRGIDALTGLEAHLALHEAEIRQAATAIPAGDQPAPIPGFEVAGAWITRTEVLEGTPAEWHDLLRERSARVVYANGVDVLAASGTATDGGMLSPSGGTRFLMETLSESKHSLASFLVLPLGVVVLIAMAAVLAFGRGFGRFQALGFGVAVASLPALTAGVLGLALLALVGGGSGLADEVHAMASEIVDVPLRNGVTALLVGLVAGVPARVLGMMFRVRAPELAEDGA